MLYPRYLGGLLRPTDPLAFRRALRPPGAGPAAGFDNAQAGYGYHRDGRAYLARQGRAVSFSLNFDIIAHELGHLILYQEIGQPTDATAGGEYYGFHESAADLVGLLAAAHFESVIDPLLENTRGNLYVFNRLNRIGEVSDNDQIRLASNGVRLAEFQHGWDEEHDLSLPLTGAMFDILVDIFHELLLEEGLISSGVEDLADQVERVPEFENLIQSLFDRAYARNPPGFRRALLDARDTLGTYLAATWQRLSPHHLTYADVAAAMIEVDHEQTRRPVSAPDQPQFRATRHRLRRGRPAACAAETRAATRSRRARWRRRPPRSNLPCRIAVDAGVAAIPKPLAAGSPGRT